MCRLFGFLSLKKIEPYHYIFNTKYSILRQAEYEGHRDGWGLCEFEGGKLVFLAKSIKPITDSKEDLKAILSQREAKNFMFFIRLASNPRGIDKRLLINLEATQPFYYNDIAFMHNGSIEVPDEVLAKLAGFKISARSLNDSEAYFLAFLKFLEEEKDVYKAIKRSEELILEAYKESNSNKKYAFSSLNVIIGFKGKLYAYNRYLSNYKKALIDPNREYYKMCFKAEKDKIIIASEPLEDEGWEDLGNDKFLEAGIEGEELVYRII